MKMTYGKLLRYMASVAMDMDNEYKTAIKEGKPESEIQQAKENSDTIYRAREIIRTIDKDR